MEGWWTMGASTPMAGLLIFCLVVFCRCLRKHGIEIPVIPMGFLFPFFRTMLFGGAGGFFKQSGDFRKIFEEPFLEIVFYFVPGLIGAELQ
jgi:hypothetical protein